METTNRQPFEFPPDIVAVMYAPAICVAAGWPLVLAGWFSDSLGLAALGLMVGLCGLVMAPPMAVIALYRALRVDPRRVIWGAALLDAVALAGTGLVILVAAR
jgi:hypothetical protein